MDSMTLYRGMDIGTAKPTLEERGGVPHHLIDVLDPWEQGGRALPSIAAGAGCGRRDPTSRQADARGRRYGPLFESAAGGLFQRAGGRRGHSRVVLKKRPTPREPKLCTSDCSSSIMPRLHDCTPATGGGLSGLFEVIELTGSRSAGSRPSTITPPPRARRSCA